VGGGVCSGGEVQPWPGAAPGWLAGGSLGQGGAGEERQQDQAGGYCGGGATDCCILATALGSGTVPAPLSVLHLNIHPHMHYI
jgi:hypothetical protein